MPTFGEKSSHSGSVQLQLFFSSLLIACHANYLHPTISNSYVAHSACMYARAPNSAFVRVCDTSTLMGSRRSTFKKTPFVRSSTSIFTRRKSSITRIYSDNEDFSEEKLKDDFSPSRRTFLQHTSNSCIGPMFLSVSALTNTNIFRSEGVANAACLSGDIREECIGVYKLPLDDAVLPYVESPETLKRFAPDLKWVPPIEYPKSYSDAVTQLKQQRGAFDSVQESIAKGELNKGGLILLDITPKVNSAGIVIGRSFNNAANRVRNLEMKKINSGKNARQKESDSESRTNSSDATTLEMKAYRIEYSLNELLGYLGESDILIGQGLRGDLGVSAPAQIQILSSLSEAQKAFDELLRVVPEKI